MQNVPTGSYTAATKLCDTIIHFATASMPKDDLEKKIYAEIVETNYATSGSI